MAILARLRPDCNIPDDLGSRETSGRREDFPAQESETCGFADNPRNANAELLGRLLVRQAMQRAESQDKIHSVDTNHWSIPE